jgi:cell wall-associated NlpC family hydrolase
MSAVPRRRHTVLAALLATAVTAGALLPAGSPASATTAPVHGHFTSAWQSRVTHQVHVHGIAYDPSHLSSSLTVGIFIDGKHRKILTAKLPSHVGMRGVHGHHSFNAVLSWPKYAHRVTLAVYEHGQRWFISTVHLGHRTPKGEKIVSVAQRYVGYPYSYGAAGPYAFDCSGFAMFVFRKADVASLPHNAEAQRERMHLISRSHARPGDLVFYMSGGAAYHVSIYAGHGMQYSATDPAEGVRHQDLTSSNVEFGTDWH